MLTIAVIEDQPKDCETLKGFFDKLAKEEGKRFSLAFFHTGEAFLLSFQKGQYDLVLMDIELGKGINGLETSKGLRKIDDNVTLIFMTNLAQYAIDGYKFNAFDYCVKPITYWDFKIRIKNALSRIEKNHKTKVLVNSEGNKRVIEANNIYYIEVDNHILIYHTSEGDFQSYGSLKEESKEFTDLGFAKCNSCFLVNLAYVQKVNGFDVTVAGKVLLISHPKRKAFLDSLNKFLSQS